MSGYDEQEEPHQSLIQRIRAPFAAPAFATISSILITATAYSFIWDWKFAFGFVGMLLVHESGHVFEAHRQGIPIHPPDLVPFFGAVTLLKEMPADVWREAKVALAGPIVGSAATLAVWGAAAAIGSDELMMIAFAGASINLLNLVPLVPLDGGRAITALHPLSWILGLGGLGLLAHVVRSPIVIFVSLLIGWLAIRDLWFRWSRREEFREEGYYEVRPLQRLAVMVVYLGLAAVLTVALIESYESSGL